MKIAILTGASSGLGAAYAQHIAEIFPEIENIWIIARRAQRLNELAARGEGKMTPVALDLTTDEGLARLREKLEKEKPQVMLLVNNAGCGFLGEFSASNEEEQLRSIDLNIRALTRLTRLALDFMPKGARILNTSSIASFVPNANMAVYSASKAYVTFFSRALNEELRGSGRSSTAVCPAPMDTEFLAVGRVKGNSATFDRLPYCSVDAVARGALKAARRHRAVYTPRVFYRFYRFLTRLLPDWVMIRLART